MKYKNLAYKRLILSFVLDSIIFSFYYCEICIYRSGDYKIPLAGKFFFGEIIYWILCSPLVIPIVISQEKENGGGLAILINVLLLIAALIPLKQFAIPLNYHYQILDNDYFKIMNIIIIFISTYNIYGALVFRVSESTDVPEHTD